MREKKILFYYLSAFSHTGGIEKFNRCFIKAVNQYFHSNIVSVYDQSSDLRYNTSGTFKGFNKKRTQSVWYVIREAFKHDILILGHINLAIAGVIVKLIRPRCQLIVIAHGIEVWSRLFFIKKWCLQKADMILAVSNYTKNQLVLKNNISPSKIRLFPNTIDPFFNLPQSFTKPSYLLERYGLSPDKKVIFTLSRLSSSEQYKGYDKVIEALPDIIKEIPESIYILAGKYDSIEKNRIEALLQQYKVSGNVILTGYVDDNEIGDHYKLADVFIMPSRKEGFGIVFLEALACGTPVIGGNQDGTVDALQNGSLGKLINPTKITEITMAIISQLRSTTNQPGTLQKKVMDEHGFASYQQRLHTYLTDQYNEPNIN